MKERYPRLTHPLVREDGELRRRPGTRRSTARPRASEGEADEHGPPAFGMFSCSKATNEVNFLAQKFARQVIGSNNIDSCNRT